jgi:uncharacterized protein (TIGR03437 family)
MRIQVFLLLLVMSCVAFAQPPSVADGGVLNGASFVKGQAVTVGSLVSIFGTNLASGLSMADTIPLSTSLGGVTVQFVNGGTSVNAPLVFVAGSQINAQIPWSLVPGSATQNVNVMVTLNSVASAPSQVTVAPFSPGIFTAGPPAFRAIAQNVDGTLAQPAGSLPGLTTHSVKIGDAIIIYATGLGAVDFPPADGAVPPSPEPRSSNGLVNTLNTPIVNIIIPPNAPTGDAVPLQIQMGGVTSPNNVTIGVTQ